MEILDMSGLISINYNDNGEKIVDGVFDGVRVTQTLAVQNLPGFWGYNPATTNFEYVVADTAGLKFSTV